MARARRCILVVAGASGARAVRAGFLARAKKGKLPVWELIPLDTHHTLVVSGIGKGNAGAAVGRCVEKGSCSYVVSVGLAGALPGAGPLPRGAVVAATHCVYADEGAMTPRGFFDCAELGFPVAPAPFEGNRGRVPERVLSRLRPLANRCDTIATVSTCSETDELARVTAVRTGAAAEAME